MEFVKHTEIDPDWIKSSRRSLINGPPNSWKTSSLATWPKPLHIVSFPGEKGTNSIPYGPGVSAYLPDELDPNANVSWSDVIDKIRRITFEILCGKHGDIKSFAGDGLHKLYACFLAEATSGASWRGEEFEAKLYSKAHTKFLAYLDTVLRSPVEYVVFTCWDGAEKDNDLDKDSKAPRHKMPELPGKLSKLIMGEFSVVLYAKVEGIGTLRKGSWQIQPQGDVWGAGVKCPLAIAKTLPGSCVQDWSVFEKLVIPQ